ncbi:MAG: hypothetical protein OEZ22_07510 [Spirochaetia bacterium]|nr:hypothetical protein [Spirochaetia bacterium]
MKTTIKLITFVIAGLFLTQLWAQSSAKNLRMESNSQKSIELDETEENLDEKILEMNKSLGNYHKLQDVPINYTPAQTKFNKGKDYIEIESYSFNGKSYNKNNIVGMTTKKMKLFFNGNTLTKVETSVMQEDYEKRTKTENTIIDVTPLTKDLSDVVITNTVNSGNPYNLIVKDMENTVSNPMRIEFKRNFYLKNLMYFEKLFRYTESFQVQKDKNNDEKIIKELTDSIFDK